MNEAKVRSEVFNLVERLYYWPFSVPNLAAAGIYAPTGRPDILCLHPTKPSIVIECKDMTTDTRFDFAEISGDQRAWLEMWAADGGWGYLALGTQTGRAGADKNPRRIWIVEWSAWMAVEKIALPRKSATIEMISIELEPWRLVFKDSKWHLPMGHSIGHIYQAEERDLKAWRTIWKETKEKYQ